MIKKDGIKNEEERPYIKCLRRKVYEMIKKNCISSD